MKINIYFADPTLELIASINRFFLQIKKLNSKSKFNQKSINWSYQLQCWISKVNVDFHFIVVSISLSLAFGINLTLSCFKLADISQNVNNSLFLYFKLFLFLWTFSILKILLNVAHFIARPIVIVFYCNKISIKK